MSDPKKNFRCKNGHVLNDSERPWGKDSICPRCERLTIEFQKLCVEKDFTAFVEYIIQPTDSVRSIAERFRVYVRDLAAINPAVCTPLPQMGIKLYIPVNHLRIDDTIPFSNMHPTKDPLVYRTMERDIIKRIHLAKCEMLDVERMLSLEEVITQIKG
jgi:hypothetical protein